MLVVISDLHFEEEASDVISVDGAGPPVEYQRNIPSRAYRRLMASLAREAERNGAKRLDLVLAGDIFDLDRTSLWFEPVHGEEVRPYDAATTEVATGSALEAKILEIVEAIAREPQAGGTEPTVADTLAAFQELARGRYRRDPGDPASEEAFPIPADRIAIHYVPGNHDRLVDSTDSVRQRVRQLLGMGDSGGPFAHQLRFEDPSVLVRHGHEYDRFTFSADHRKTRTLPVELPAEQYAQPAFGNFVTVAIASRLPVLFRREHGAGAIVADPVLRAVYLRLLEFDDLRPQSALVRFLLATPVEGVTEKRIWRAVEPVARALLEEVHEHPYLRGWLKGLEKRWWPDRIDAIQALLDSKFWRRGITLGELRLLATHAWSSGAGEEDGPVDHACREAAIRDGSVRFLVAGHTHRPRVELLYADRRGERYYVDTGTWRNRILTNRDQSGFRRLKSLTYVVFYASDEDRGGRGAGQPKLESMDYWSGFTQRWPVE